MNIVICHSQLFAVPNSPFWHLLRHPDTEKQKLHFEWACEIKKMINHRKRFIKQPVIKQSSTFLRVYFLIGENLKKLIEIFRQEVIGANVIFIFLET